MKITVVLFLGLLLNTALAQNKRTTFYDTAGNQTTYEGHWAYVLAGPYKSEYNKRENKRTLIKTTAAEFESELRKTEKRITSTDKLGTDFPAFDLTDIQGNRLTKGALQGKVVVINYWFIGCAPCEVERPALNQLADRYMNREDVVFLSFARNSNGESQSFLSHSPVHYTVVPTEKDYIKKQFGVNGYPTNVIVGKDGKYVFNSLASGIGIANILERQIEIALNK